jgi:hypothetical protein
MPKSLLLVCPSCQCHVRVVDSSCPFCGLALSESSRAALALRPAGARLGRAAFYAFSMGTLSLAAACSSTGGSGTDGGNDSNEESCVCPPYGQPAYGLPADALAPDVGPADSGRPTESGTPDASDAGSDAQEGGIFPPYGHPPVDSGSNG